MAVMDFDDALPRARPDDIIAQLGREDLDRLSVSELEERIALLTAEIGQIGNCEKQLAALDENVTFIAGRLAHRFHVVHPFGAHCKTPTMFASEQTNSA